MGKIKRSQLLQVDTEETAACSSREFTGPGALESVHEALLEGFNCLSWRGLRDPAHPVNKGAISCPLVPAIGYFAKFE